MAGCSGCQRRADSIAGQLRQLGDRMETRKGSTLALLAGGLVLVLAAGAAAGVAAGRREG